MTTIETVRGAVPIEQIGATLPHEHIFVQNPELRLDLPDPEWEGDDVMIRRAAAALDDIKALGIDSVVDLTVPGLGRYIPHIQRVAELTSVNIVVATGYYTLNVLPAYFQTHGPGRKIDVADPLPAMMIRDIQDGIGDTGVKAGIIKVATDEPGLTPDVERVLAAAAQAHLATGATISTHSLAGRRNGVDQQRVLSEHGVPPEHLVIGHSGDTDDFDYLRRLMDAGSTIGLDRFGTAEFLDDEARMDVVVGLVEAGYAGLLTLSHDAAVYSYNSPPSYRSKHQSDYRYSRIPGYIIPELRRRGVGDDAIHQILVGNPARILRGAGR